MIITAPNAAINTATVIGRNLKAENADSLNNSRFFLVNLERNGQKYTEQERNKKAIPTRMTKSASFVLLL